MRFFIDKDHITEGRILLTPEDSQHIVRVLRKRVGEELELCDGQGTDYSGILCSIDQERVQVRLDSARPSQTEPTAEVTLYAGLSKGERFDFLIQKAVELGVSRIVPFISRHCVVKVDAKESAKKQARMQKIALEACKQSLRGKIVEIGEICTYQQALKQAALSQCPLLLYEKENRSSLKTILQEHRQDSSFAVITGPEGGFSREEAEQALEASIPSVSIGNRILRCETAPLAALCAIMYETSNFDFGV